MSLRILRIRDVQYATGLSRTSIYRKVNEGSFPKPVSLGEQAIGWREHEVDAWIEALPLAKLVPPPPSKEA